jgi:hypothetical protein
MAVPSGQIEKRIFVIHGHRVMIDADLAEMYEVPTKALNQAVKRNPERFPEDFMFRLTAEEADFLKSQSVTSSWGGRRRSTPTAFTEQGVAMLSSFLNRPISAIFDRVRAGSFSLRNNINNDVASP